MPELVTTLEGHVNAAEYWMMQADLYDFPNPARAECLQSALTHALLAHALTVSGLVRDA